MEPSVSYEPLTPLTFLDRSAMVYPDKTAVVYGDTRYTYAQLRERVLRLAGALQQAGVGKGDRVAYMAPNLPQTLKGHFGPMHLGAVLVAINTRLGPREVSYILNHSGAKVLIFDSEYAATIRAVKSETPNIGTFVQVVDTQPKADDIPGPDYESFIAAGDPLTPRVALDDERDTVAINYTSGTTGDPKGVAYHSRGAYLNALGNAIEMSVNWRSNYLWTVPMFHCNGWCFTWTVTAVGGTHVCLRRADPNDIYRLIREEGITHFGCAPTVLTSLYASPDAAGQDLSGVTIATGGAPPAPHVIKTMEAMGASVYHLYGLTETYGPNTVCEIQPHWLNMSPDDRALEMARQGVPHVTAGMGVRVVDEQMNDVPQDGETMGEIVMQGNTVMSGYYADPEGTAIAFRAGWFHSGDLAVWHDSGYIEIKDRAKDIIISGGENISSQEVEKVIMEHPAVLETCVVGVPDAKWGEVPKAFVVKREGVQVTGEEIIAFCRERIAHFKAPKYVEFGDLPKTSTGKIQKFVLRDREWAGHGQRVKG